jgi:hypothetical protein
MLARVAAMTSAQRASAAGLNKRLWDGHIISFEDLFVSMTTLTPPVNIGCAVLRYYVIAY